MKKVLISVLMLMTFFQKGNSQGCVIVRNISGFGQYNFSDNAFSSSDWQINITNRYFKSFRDYRGTTDLKLPGDSVQTNRVFSTDFSISRLMKKGWSITLSVPFSSSSRESKLEHGGVSNQAHKTHSFGIGDIRFTAYKWLVSPAIKQKFNIQLGLGLKFPTGDYKYQDYFYRKEDSAVLAPVNPSIQLGDGGTGIITELNGFYKLNNHIIFYGNLFYMTNPREQNGTSNLLGRNPTPVQLKTGGTINSVPDQYSIRAGVFFNFSRSSVTAGIRDEGIPVYDLIGGSNGNRRAGHNLSIEPGYIYKMKKVSLYAYLPVIVSRKIKQTVPDKKETEIIGKYTLRQGGFGNYLIFVGIQIKL